ncbi:MAG: hypothetical protein JWO90_984, partial [Solirubrobacterales bacterium]|nr:hypothetical protein [Solirubrobacterales bacterium]
GRLVLVTTWSPRPWLRAAFDALAAAVPDAFAGLHATDPRPELAEAGWRPGHAAVLRRGYPSLVVLARRA